MISIKKFHRIELKVPSNESSWSTEEKICLRQVEILIPYILESSKRENFKLKRNFLKNDSVDFFLNLI